MGQIPLKHLQPAQYESWLRKAEDPEWNAEEFGCSTRSKSERAAASLALELRDHLEAIAAKDEQIRQLREALAGYRMKKGPRDHRDCEDTLPCDNRCDLCKAADALLEAK